VALDSELTIPTERPPPVGEVSANLYLKIHKLNALQRNFTLVTLGQIRVSVLRTTRFLDFVHLPEL
jgi:hypothetical protein